MATSKYPWNDWLDGESHEIVVDTAKQANSVVSGAYQRARKFGFPIVVSRRVIPFNDLDEQARVRAIHEFGERPHRITIHARRDEDAPPLKTPPRGRPRDPWAEPYVDTGLWAVQFSLHEEVSRFRSRLGGWAAPRNIRVRSAKFNPLSRAFGQTGHPGLRFQLLTDPNEKTSGLLVRGDHRWSADAAGVCRVCDRMPANAPDAEVELGVPFKVCDSCGVAT